MGRGCSSAALEVVDAGAGMDQPVGRMTTLSFGEKRGMESLKSSKGLLHNCWWLQRSPRAHVLSVPAVGSHL